MNKESDVNLQQAVVYTLDDLTRLLRFSMTHVKEMRIAGRIPGEIKTGGRHVRFSRAIVDRWLAGEQPPPQTQENSQHAE